MHSKKCFFYHVTGTARPRVNQTGKNSLQSANNTNTPYQHLQALGDSCNRITDNVYQQNAAINSPHNTVPMNSVNKITIYLIAIIMNISRDS